jgi:hypothetical protein
MIEVRSEQTIFLQRLFHNEGMTFDQEHLLCDPYRFSSTGWTAEQIGEKIEEQKKAILSCIGESWYQRKQHVG